MKAQALNRYNDDLGSDSWVNFETVDDPKIEKANDVIVRIGGAGVCRTDLHIIEGVWRPHLDPEGDSLLPGMALADRGLVELAIQEYKLSDANLALQDLNNGKIKGRAVLTP